MDLRDIIAKNLRLIRGHRGFTQVEVADRAGIDEKYISQLEKASNAPTVSTLERLAEALGVETYILLMPEPPPELLVPARVKWTPPQPAPSDED